MPLTNQVLKAWFLDHIEQQIKELRDDLAKLPATDNGSLVRRNRLRHLHAMLAVIHDTTSLLVSAELDASFRACSNQGDVDGLFLTYFDHILDHIGKLLDQWNEKNRADKPEKAQLEVNLGRHHDRDQHSAADADAKEVIQSWYEECILTGSADRDMLEAAHIIDVPLANLKHREPDRMDLWNGLKKLWPAEEHHSVLLEEQNDQRNILPLEIVAHWFWDNHYLALRPIPHPSDPVHRLYIQVMWLEDIDEEGNLAHSPWDHRKAGIVDLRRLHFNEARHGNSFADSIYVKHGDVYELITPNAESRPLPNLHFLQVRFALQKLHAGMLSAGALDDIFCGVEPSPTDDVDPVIIEEFLPRVWDKIIKTAKYKFLLGYEAAECWRGYIAMQEYRDHQRKERELDSEDFEVKTEVLSKAQESGEGVPVSAT
ncbi:hypothetical protein QBC35DRAFT_433290 [Podospora australis]|uniref:HNH nuclease domain-containing protein n=1 Tax=Podospora australis TaxID=1536484 RepID=A0AAN7AJX6_9PEZI|nr:hypothetical protein QBC35DRAFT_433290 [Podospora australis]